jgi:hypothetical protein
MTSLGAIQPQTYTFSRDGFQKLSIFKSTTFKYEAYSRDETDLDNLWKKISRAWREGDILATVGTGSLTSAEEQEFGLVGNHNYSVFGTVT